MKAQKVIDKLKKMVLYECLAENDIIKMAVDSLADANAIIAINSLHENFNIDTLKILQPKINIIMDAIGECLEVSLPITYHTLRVSIDEYISGHFYHVSKCRDIIISGLTKQLYSRLSKSRKKKVHILNKAQHANYIDFNNIKNYDQAKEYFNKINIPCFNSDAPIDKFYIIIANAIFAYITCNRSDDCMTEFDNFLDALKFIQRNEFIEEDILSSTLVLHAEKIEVLYSFVKKYSTSPSNAADILLYLYPDTKKYTNEKTKDIFIRVCNPPYKKL